MLGKNFIPLIRWWVEINFDTAIDHARREIYDCLEQCMYRLGLIGLDKQSSQRENGVCFAAGGSQSDDFIVLVSDDDNSIFPEVVALDIS